MERSWFQGLGGGFWKRRKYHKLNGSTRTRRRFLRFKISPKLRFLRRMPSPKKLLVCLRDAYVSMMLALADSRVFTAGGGAFGRRAVKEYDEKVIVEIYKSIVAARGETVRISVE